MPDNYRVLHPSILGLMEFAIVGNNTRTAPWDDVTRNLHNLVINIIMKVVHFHFGVRLGRRMNNNHACCGEFGEAC